MSLIVDGTTGVTFNDSSLQGAAASPYVLKNRIINGDCRIDQRNAGASVTPTDNSYTLDRWQSRLSQASKFSVQQSTTAPANFVNSMLVTSLSSYTVGASEFFQIRQIIEGFNTADFGFGTASAQPLTISFWVRSSLTGTFGGVLSNSDGSRSYAFSYTVSVANTWEQKSITIAGDTTGTWQTTTGGGFVVAWSLGAGASVSTTAGSWNASLFRGVTGAQSVVGTNGATFYITGVQLERGTSATPFERRLYNQELANCQRYYYRRTQAASTAYTKATAFSSTSIGFSIPFPVEMRIVPTALEQTGTASNYAALNTTGGNISCSSVPTYNSATTNYSAWTNFTVASGLTAGNASAAWSAASSYLAWSAEL